MFRHHLRYLKVFLKCVKLAHFDEICLHYF